MEGITTRMLIALEKQSASVRWVCIVMLVTVLLIISGFIVFNQMWLKHVNTCEKPSSARWSRMRARNMLRRYLNPDRERLIDEKVHSEVGRRALKLVFIDGYSLLKTSEAVGMVYSTFTDNYYHRWLPELFADFGDG